LFPDKVWILNSDDGIYSNKKDSVKDGAGGKGSARGSGDVVGICRGVVG